MLITRRSPVTGANNTMALPIVEPWGWQRLPFDVAVTLALVHLSRVQNEFYTRGVTPADTRRLAGEPVFGQTERVLLDGQAGFIVAVLPGLRYAVKLDAEADAREHVPEAKLARAPNRLAYVDTDELVKPEARLKHLTEPKTVSYVGMTEDGYIKVVDPHDQFAEATLASPAVYGTRIIVLEV